jgi:hypothetical protein
MRHITRVFASLVVVSLAVALAGLGVGSAAYAHNDKGIFAVESADVSQPVTVALVVKLVYSGDREPASAATVTATPVSASGEALTAVPLTLTPDHAGRYAGMVTMPSGGSWTIRLDALDPTATLEVPVNVMAPTTTTMTTTTTVPPTASTVAPSPSTDDSSSNAAPMIAVALALSAIGAGGYLYRWKRRSSGPPA